MNRPIAPPSLAVAALVAASFAFAAVGSPAAASATASTTASTTATATVTATAGPAGRALSAYADDLEFERAIGRWRERAAAERRDRQRTMQSAGGAPMPGPPTAAAPASAERAAPAADAITNVQVQGVDEGGIVKSAGEYLVVLRRGRLFTVRVGGDALVPVAAVDAYAPDVDPRASWYDELLVAGRDVVVVGYSYARGGTEIGLFTLGDDGSLRHRATHHLRSADYWSSRNYASRLIGRTLVLYSPTLLSPWGPPVAQAMPGVRRWQGAATPPSFRPILPATRIHRTDDDFDPREPLALHTVTRCELGDGTMDCTATAVLGPAGRVFHVSREAVYVWTSTSARPPADARAPAPQALSAVFRLPLDGRAPAGLKTVGVPIDAFSFLEDADGTLNVLLRARGPGESMWGGERSGGAMALLRVPAADFGDGRGAARDGHYRALPAAAGAVRNRYVGDWLLWGGTAGGADGTRGWALRFRDAAAPALPLAPGHGVERIEALGRDALLVGASPQGLHFSAVSLADGAARLAGTHLRPGARQGDRRSHGFFYRADDASGGLLALPYVEPGPPRAALAGEAVRAPAGVAFLRSRALRLSALGELAASGAPRADGCVASCVDWYGNARPVFAGGRVFALLGYELVEGVLGASSDGESIAERRRVDFAPAATLPGGRGSPFGS